MSTPLTRLEISRHGRELRDRLARLAAEVDALQREALDPSGGARFQDVDESIEETALQADMAVLAAEDESAYEIREALERIDQNVYGRCESCDEWIARARLELIPEARLCAPCARREQDSG